jgi:hypothetical protein
VRLYPLNILALLVSAQAETPSAVTFYKDVLPVLRENCQRCHRPGEVAPASFLTYETTRPWAQAIKAAVLTKKMPPWFADPRFGQFSNDRSLSEGDVRTLVSWVNAGSPKGEPPTTPRPVEGGKEWSIGQPDLVISMPSAYHIPASGSLRYRYLEIPTGFTEDKYVQFVEVRPGNPKLVHHILVFARAPGQSWFTQTKLPGVPTPGDLLAAYLPGTDPPALRRGRARVIKAGSDLVVQLHYTPDGSAGTDISKVGLIFSRTRPVERVVAMNVSNMKFAIPPGAPDTEVKAELTLQRDATLINLLPHMHLRGKSFQYRAIYPNGTSEILLSVPRFDFNWQLIYHVAAEKKLPKGTVISCEAHYDNSRNNPFNPDPTKEVFFGQQTWEEMMVGFFDVAVPVNTEVEDLTLPKYKPANSHR